MTDFKRSILDYSTDEFSDALKNKKENQRIMDELIKLPKDDFQKVFDKMSATPSFISSIFDYFSREGEHSKKICYIQLDALRNELERIYRELKEPNLSPEKHTLLHKQKDEILDKISSIAKENSSSLSKDKMMVGFGALVIACAYLLTKK